MNVQTSEMATLNVVPDIWSREISSKNMQHLSR